MEALKSLVPLRNVKHILTHFLRSVFQGAHSLRLKSVSVAQQSFPDILNLFLNVQILFYIASPKYVFSEVESAGTKDFSP